MPEAVAHALGAGDVGLQIVADLPLAVADRLCGRPASCSRAQARL